MTSPSYDKYLKSAHWKRKKQEVATAIPRVCFVCRATSREAKIHLHHKTYKNIGSEKISDFVWLCNKCHELVHWAVKERKIELFIAADEVKKIYYHAEQEKDKCLVKKVQKIKERRNKLTRTQRKRIAKMRRETPPVIIKYRACIINKGGPALPPPVIGPDGTFNKETAYRIV